MKGSLVLVAWSCLAPLQAAPPPQRIVSLAPNLCEILFDLGAARRIVGVSLYCDTPAARGKARVGDFVHPNLEKIVSLEPDLVVAEKWPSSRTVPRLEQLGIPVLELPAPRSLEGIYALIRALSSSVQAAAAGERMVARMQAGVRAIRERARRLGSRPGVYVELDLPSWTIGRRSFMSEALRVCGARNIFEDVDRAALQASREVILERRPDVILSFSVPAERLARRPGWSELPAVRRGRIIDDLDRSLFSRGNHRLVLGMRAFQDRLFRLMERP